jgi:S-DNA-T family DNA segregation ATPase FtsK/SpoIIIE
MAAVDPSELIGCVAARVVTLEVGNPAPNDGFAKLVMHRLSREEMVAIATVIAAEPALERQVEIALPRHYFSGSDNLANSMLSDEPITELRCQPCVPPKTARLMALVDDSQASSMGKATKITRDTFLSQGLVDTWVDAAAKLAGVTFPEETAKVLRSAFAGLIRIDRFSLRRFAKYVAEVVSSVERLSPKRALGASLWCLQIPSFPEVFDGIKNDRPSDYQRTFSRHAKNDCYLLKRTPQQSSIPRRDLEKNLEAIRNTVPSALVNTFERFIQAGENWTPEAEELSKADWNQVLPLFQNSGKVEAKGIGEKTFEVFGLLDKDRFDRSDWEYIALLKTRGKKPARSDSDIAFFYKRIAEIHEDTLLTAMWERFIFGVDLRCTSFHVGLLQCVQRLLASRTAIAGPVYVEITAVESEKLRLRRKSRDACLFFEARNKHLVPLLAGVAEFRKVEVFGYSQLLKGWTRDKGFRPPTGKRACQLGFKVRLTSTANADIHTDDIRLTWEFLPDSVLNGYAGDLKRCRDYAQAKKTAPLLLSQVELSTKNAKAAYATISLEDTSCLQPPSPTSEQGSFVPRARNSVNLADEFRKTVKLLEEKDFLDAAVSTGLVDRLRSFEDAYSSAIDAIFAGTADYTAVSQQAAQYQELLERICADVSAESARTQLLKTLLRVGMTHIKSNEPGGDCAVVCPWNPVRMESLAARESRFHSMLTKLLAEDRAAFSDLTGNLFFDEAKRDLETPGLPEVGLLWHGDDNELVAYTDNLGDYSLMEQPLAKAGQPSRTNESSRTTARQIGEITDTYLELQPHERDNFSIVLYNCDSKSLPTAVVEAISETEGDSPDDTTCRVILAHENRKVLSEFYETISAQEGDDDAFYVSEASKDFMARVRINIMVDQSARQSSETDHMTDIVFCQDVISRHANISREPMGRSGFTLAAEDLVIHRWGRRKQLVSGDPSSTLLLTSPAQTSLGWAYLNALGSVTDSDYAKRAWNDHACLIPAKKLNFDKAETSRIFEDTHALGNWVVNFDDLLDRRILKRRDIKVIRYRQSASSGRNLIISSNAKETLLRATLLQKLSGLLPIGMGAAAREEAADKFIHQANEISGNLVLRAARRGSNANELIGLVLSHRIVASELGTDAQPLCFLLDDYAAWLGQTEERIADLIILSASESANGEKQLDIVLTEAKFIGFGQLAAASTESRRQLRDSLRLLESALTAPSACLDQQLWLDRISDLLLEGTQNLDHNVDIAGWRSAVRARNIKICLRGYSQVFVHGPPEHEHDGRRFTGVEGCSGWQESYSRADVKLLVESFVTGKKHQGVLDLRIAMSGLSIADRKYSPLPTLAAPSASGSPAVTQGRPIVKMPAPTETGPALPSSVPSNSDVGPIAVAPSLGTIIPANSPSASNQQPVQDLKAREEEGAWVTDTIAKLKHALLKRQLSAELIEARPTPNALLCRMKGSDRLTVDLLQAKASEIRTTDGLDIISVREGIGELLLMLARPTRQVLSLPEVWSNWRTSGDLNTDLLIALKENDGGPLFLSPFPQPHTLIAGFTGSGKSVLIQNIILAIGATNSPSNAQIAIIDPKQGLDFLAFEDLPHLHGPVITEQEDAIDAFEGFVVEMERRYALFKKARVQTIEQFTEKTGEHMARLWIVHDEFGDWMQNEPYKDRVPSLVNRLGQKSRAAGIYLIFCSQRPDNSIFPMVLRANLGNRLVLKVDAPGTSEIATGQKNLGAEKLLGKGHLLALLGNYEQPLYAQVPFISSDDLQKMVAQIRDRYTTKLAIE